MIAAACWGKIGTHCLYEQARYAARLSEGRVPAGGVKGSQSREQKPDEFESRLLTGTEPGSP
jgi:hypothetical protein